MDQRYKNKLLVMMSYFHTVCENYKLRYYAIGGTFLGALRHNGFIPWDNDIDVAMPRKDYNKIAEIINNDGSKYVVEGPQSKSADYLYTNAKMYDTTTTLVENLRVKTVRGVFLDIFPMDGIGNTIEEVKSNYKRINFLNNLFAARSCTIRSQRVWWKNCVIWLFSIIPEKMLDTKAIIIKLDNICQKYKFDESAYVGVLLTQYGLKYVMPREIFDKRREYAFESISIVGVEDYDRYLSLLFGDWHKLPPKEKQVEGHDYKYIDLNHSYLEGTVK